MDQDAEKLYNPSNWSARSDDPNQVIQAFYHFITSKSGVMEAAGEAVVEKNVRYGQGTAALVDIYKQVNAPTDAAGKLFIFIHGGYWQEGSKDCYGFMRPLVSRGYTVLVPGYDLTPLVTLKTVMEQMKELLDFLNRYTQLNDIKETWVCGHSAGAQLALSLLQDLSIDSSWHFIDGFILISGVYDLLPLISTSINVKLRLSHDEAKELSPIVWNQKDFLERLKQVTFLFVVGQEESPVFIQQTKDMVKRLVDVGVKNVDLVCLPEYDHYNIITDLYEENSGITRSVLETLNRHSGKSLPN